eukprot:207177-Chlamydomonas_euryale.AAC.1
MYLGPYSCYIEYFVFACPVGPLIEALITSSLGTQRGQLASRVRNTSLQVKERVQNDIVYTFECQHEERTLHAGLSSPRLNDVAQAPPVCTPARIVPYRTPTQSGGERGNTPFRETLSPCILLNYQCSRLRRSRPSTPASVLPPAWFYIRVNARGQGCTGRAYGGCSTSG